MDPFLESCRKLRGAIKEVGSATKSLAERAKAEAAFDVSAGAPPPDRGEMVANTILAYRHLEDAAMRLGKAIQAYDGGVSVYDK